MKLRARAYAWIFAGLATAMIAPGNARAADRVAQADALFREAIVLMKAGRYPEACPKLAQSQALDPGAGTQFRLAECYEKVDRLVLAIALFNETIEAAKKSGRKDREQQSRARVDAIQARLPKLLAGASPEAQGIAGLEIAVDGAPILRANLDKPVPIDPGEHTVSATAPGKSPWQQKVVAREGMTLAVTVPHLDGAKPLSVDEAQLAAARDAGPSKTLVGVGGGLAALSLIGAIAFTVVSNGKSADADALRRDKNLGDSGCSGKAALSECTDLHALNAQSDTFHNLAVAGYIAAGVLGAATLTYALWPRKKPAEPSSRVLPWLAPGALGASAQSTF